MKVSKWSLILTLAGALIVFCTVLLGAHVYRWMSLTWVALACFWVTVAYAGRRRD